MCGQFGIDVDRPLMCQVSRFDPWKDPLGVIDAYRIVKAEMPDVQLALVGSMATDDPEALADRIVALQLSVRDAEALTRAKSKAPPRTPAAKPEKDADTRQLEESVESSLGMRVTILDKGAKGGEKGYILLREALKHSGKIGIAKVAIRSRENLGALFDQVLLQQRHQEIQLVSRALPVLTR